VSERLGRHVWSKVVPPAEAEVLVGRIAARQADPIVIAREIAARMGSTEAGRAALTAEGRRP